MAGRAEKTLAEGLAAMGMDFPEVPLYIKIICLQGFRSGNTRKRLFSTVFIT